MVLQELSLRGKTALVTGGGSGIGSGITRGLAEAGADIACVYSRHPPTEIEAYVRGLGREFLAIQADVSRMSELPRVMDETVTRFGHLDILVNNAGICPRASALEYTEEMWDQVIQLNEKAVFFLSQLAARQFLRQGTGGRIINLASMLSFLGGFNTTAYTASKHAIEGYAECLAQEVAPFGIQVMLIEPGDHRGGSSRCRLTSAAMTESSPYWADFRKGTEAIRRDEENGSDPVKLGRRVAELLTREKLPFRKKIGSPAQMLAPALHKVLPGRAMNRILRQYTLGGK